MWGWWQPGDAQHLGHGHLNGQTISRTWEPQGVSKFGDNSFSRIVTWLCEILGVDGTRGKLVVFSAELQAVGEMGNFFSFCLMFPASLGCRPTLS